MQYEVTLEEITTVFAQALTRMLIAVHEDSGYHADIAARVYPATDRGYSGELGHMIVISSDKDGCDLSQRTRDAARMLEKALHIIQEPGGGLP